MNVYTKLQQLPTLQSGASLASPMLKGSVTLYFASTGFLASAEALLPSQALASPQDQPPCKLTKQPCCVQLLHDVDLMKQASLPTRIPIHGPRAGRRAYNVYQEVGTLQQELHYIFSHGKVGVNLQNNPQDHLWYIAS